MTLKIEEGKFYRDSAGNRVGPMAYNGEEKIWYVEDELGQWDANGRVVSGFRWKLKREWVDEEQLADSVSHPPHYTDHPSGIECIDVTEHMNFCRGNAMKYLWRAGSKGDEIEDLEKARWYIDREIARLQKAGGEA